MSWDRVGMQPMFKEMYGGAANVATDDGCLVHTSIRERKFAVKLSSAQFRNTSDVGIIVFSPIISTITCSDTLFYYYCL